MSFAASWAFAGLALLAVLVVAHLRRRGEVVREVPSLLLWEQLAGADATGRRGLRPPALPLLLLAQALVLALLVFALARPRSSGPPATPVQIIVLDDSWRMQAAGRLSQARLDVEEILDGERAQRPVRIVLADGLPAVVYRGTAAGARRALAHVNASAAPANIAAALTIADGNAARGDSIVLIRAPEDPLPAIGSGSARLRTLTLPGVADQGIFEAGARCGIGASAACEVRATLRSTASHAVVDRVAAQAAGHAPLRLTVRVPADGSAPLALASEPGQAVSLRLEGHDSLPADDEAWVTVPAAGDLPSSSVVMLVGQPTVALATARAFAAVPGVVLRLRTPATFRPGEARAAGLLVLDHFVPRSGIPAAPAVLLVAPPRLPGGRVGGALGETVVSGTDAGSELLGGVELSSLSIDGRAASRLTLPTWLSPLAWSPEGALLAAGDNGRQRVAALAFEPGQSNLPELPALPILAANLVRWAGGWAPTSAVAGVPFALEAAPGVSAVTLARDGHVLARLSARTPPLAATVSQPGLYTVQETGRGISRSSALAVDTGEAPVGAGQAVELQAIDSGAGASVPVNRADWFLLAALLVLFAEWGYWVSQRRRLAL